MSIHKTFSPDLRTFNTQLQENGGNQHHLLSALDQSDVVQVDIPYRQDKKGMARAATSEAAIRTRHQSTVTSEAPRLAKLIRQRHKQIKSHFREIKQLVEQPAGRQQHSNTYLGRDQRSIKKTELTANDIFTPKQLEKLDGRGIQKHTTKPFGRRNNQKQEEVRKQIRGFLQWGGGPSEKDKRMKQDTSYRRFLQRPPIEQQHTEIMPYWNRTAKEKQITPRKKHSHNEEDIYQTFQKQLDDMSETVSRKVLHENSNFLDRGNCRKKDKATLYRMNGLYEARMMKLAHNLFGRQNLPYRLTFGREAHAAAATTSNPFLTDSPKKHKAGLECYRQWLRQEKRRLKDTL